MQTSHGTSAQVRAALQQFTLGISSAEARRLLRNIDADEEGCSFGAQLRELFRHCVTLGHRRQLQSFTGLLRALSYSVAELEDTGEKGPVLEETAQWLLSLQGGARQGARDASIRWRCCALLTGLTEASTQRGIKLSARLLNEIGEAFRVRAKDRCGDVRLAAMEGLNVLHLQAPGASAVASDRASNDCHDLVRAAAVRALVIHSDVVPSAVIARACLDRAVRVRRALLEAMEVHARAAESGSSWAEAWSKLMLHAISDRSYAVRATAVQCLQAGIERGWLRQLFEDFDVVSNLSYRISDALAMILQRSLQPQQMQELLIEQSALHSTDNVSHDGIALPPPMALLHARVAARTAAIASTWNPSNMAQSRWALPLDENTVAAALIEALERRDAFELQQLLHVALVVTLPEGAASRAELTHAATSVLTHAPVSDAVAVFLECGLFSKARLGGSAEEVFHTAFLAMALLRRIVINSCLQQRHDKSRWTAAEAWFSRAAAAAMRGLMHALQKTSQQVETLNAKVAAAHEELEDAQWSMSACASKKLVDGGKDARRTSAMAVQEAAAGVERLQSAVTEAQAIREECHLRVVIATIAWLKLSQVPLAKDAQQRAVLEVVLRPAMETTGSCTCEAQAIQVAAVLGVAIYASKSLEYALSHWPFFIGLLKAQIPELSGETCTFAHPEGAGSVAPVALRLAEVAVLFICDSLLLHSKKLDKTQANEGFCVLAHALASVSKRLIHMGTSPQACAMLWHLRAMICDRVCCLAIKQSVRDDCTAGRWILGCLLADVCGAGPGQPSLATSCTAAASLGEASDHMHSYISMAPLTASFTEKTMSDCSADVKESLTMGPSISRSRTLRFFAMLPVLSESHAELLAVAAEAFFGGRFWMDTPSVPTGTSLRFMPAVRAACFSCRQLGGRIASKSYDELKVRVLRAVAGALLAAPAQEKSTLIDALAASIITAANGESALAWVEEHGSGNGIDAAGAISSLLGEWTTTSSAKSLESLRAEVQLRRSASNGAATSDGADVGWQWAQGALDQAADFRHDLAHLGLPAAGSCQRPRSNAAARKGPSRRQHLRRRRDEVSSSGGPVFSKHQQQQAASVIQAELDSGMKTGLQQPFSEQEILRPPVISDAETDGVRLVASGSSDAQENKTTSSGQQQPSVSLHVRAAASPQQQAAASDLTDSGAAWKLIDKSTGVAYELAKSSKLTLGRRPECDICLQALAVSGRHCTLLYIEAGIELMDLGGTNGTYVNGERMALGSKKILQDGDVMVLASLRDGPRFLLRCKQVLATRTTSSSPSAAAVIAEAAVQAALSAEAVSPVQGAVIGSAAVEVVAHEDLPAGLAGEPQLLDVATGVFHKLKINGETTLGRHKDCEVVLSSPQVSGRHCVLFVERDLVEVRDISSHGTYVNGVCLPKCGSLRVSKRLRHGDRLTLACLRGPAFVLVAAGQRAPAGCDADQQS